jgi:hypothetical protein
MRQKRRDDFFSAAKLDFVDAPKLPLPGDVRREDW